MTLNVGLVGATGLVGQTFIELLEKRSFPIGDLRLFASVQSKGQTLNFQGREIPLQTLESDPLQPHCFEGLDVVFFSSKDDVSRKWVPEAVSQGAFAIDNSSSFRLINEHLLIVPEVNGHLLPSKKNPCIVANPNCSTIQLVMALKPLQEEFGLTQVRLSTYQAVSGAGKAGKDELLQQTNDKNVPPSVFPAPIAFNCVPQVGSLNDDGFCSEEIKIIDESKKILENPSLQISSFTVRVPVISGHSQTVWVTLDEQKGSPTTHEVQRALQNFPGIAMYKNDFPTAQTTSETYPVHVGRIHKDMAFANTWLMWIVADNVYKGAALNGLQIAEHIFDITPRT